MIISHEVPISMLEKSKDFNDYDYCLLHLLIHDDYKEFYKKSSQEGRKVMLDNSLFELGDAMSPEHLIDGCNEIEPYWYIVPDCANDKETTIARFEDWKKNYQKEAYGLPMGVVQGSTFEDLISCYAYMSNNAAKVAIPFLSSAYQKMFPGITNPLEKASVGRSFLIRTLMQRGIWRYDIPCHILGSTLPGEFADPIYAKYIESLDSSCPIVNGFEGISITRDMDTKPSTKLNQLINATPTDEQLQLIEYNVDVFRGICGA